MKGESHRVFRDDMRRTWKKLTREVFYVKNPEEDDFFLGRPLSAAYYMSPALLAYRSHPERMLEAAENLRESHVRSPALRQVFDEIRQLATPEGREKLKREGTPTNWAYLLPRGIFEQAMMQAEGGHRQDALRALAGLPVDFCEEIIRTLESLVIVRCAVRRENRRSLHRDTVWYDQWWETGSYDPSFWDTSLRIHGLHASLTSTEWQLVE